MKDPLENSGFFDLDPEELGTVADIPRELLARTRPLIEELYGTSFTTSLMLPDLAPHNLLLNPARGVAIDLEGRGGVGIAHQFATMYGKSFHFGEEQETYFLAGAGIEAGSDEVRTGKVLAFLLALEAAGGGNVLVSPDLAKLSLAGTILKTIEF